MTLNKVPGHLFKQSGKWKYDVFLDYTGIVGEDGKTPDGGYISPGNAALQALRQATRNGTSGVSLTSPGILHLVVIDSPHGFPVMVAGAEEH